MIHLRSQINSNHLKIPATDQKSNQDIEFSAYKINIRLLYFSVMFFQIGIRQISFYNLIVISFLHYDAVHAWFLYESKSLISGFWFMYGKIGFSLRLLYASLGR